ncbi:MAG: hypothetical protein A4E55_01249 [Pelotomaculum sp. PtaU1.Bin035]|nr:MAG: hypothetical protein A4E55_01249 [Pelotomaculum sp. PtaU1.Bin035]
MSVALKLTILLLGLMFVVAVIYLLVINRINQRNSLPWLTGALIILTLSTIPEILEVAAHFTGVDYPPTLLFLLSTLVILSILLYQSIQISLLQDRCKELAQHLAIVNFNEESRRTEKQWYNNKNTTKIKEMSQSQNVNQSTHHFS